MAVAFDATSPDTSSESNVSSLTSTSWTIAGSDRAVFGFIGTGAVTPATHNEMRWRGSTGDTLTQKGATLSTGTYTRLSAWERVAPSAESNTSYGAWAANQDESVIGMVSYTGVNQTTPAGSITTNTGVTSGSTGTATITVSTTSGDVVVAGVFASRSLTPGTPVLTPGVSNTPTERHYNNANLAGYHAFGIYEKVATGTSTVIDVDLSGMDSGSAWGVIAFVVNAAGAGGGLVGWMYYPRKVFLSV